MTQYGEDVPAYRTIRVTSPEAPVEALTDLEAWRAREAYPDILSAGGPVFGVAVEREQGGWRLRPHLSNPTPQGAREGMSSIFRRMAQEAEQAGDLDARRECTAAAERLDWEVVDELTVRGVRHRVVRAESFIRMGPDGPEPPRPSDPDPARVGKGHQAPDPTDGFVIDPVAATGMSTGILKVELLSLVCKAGTVPAAVREDSVRAAATHPGGVLLPPTYMTAERIGGRWVPESGGHATTPQGARDGMALGFRVMEPVLRRLGPQETAEYLRAADLLDEQRSNELEVAGRRLRVVRIERLVRIGPDGPEGPRPSDPDPEPPIMVHDQQLRAQGLIPEEDDEDDEAPIQLDATGQELARRFREEEERRARLGLNR